jgi:alanyl-tRNA synthetase
VTTERLYYTDSYLTTFNAAVVEQTDGGRRVYLDRTAFYPASGGQPFDTGRVGGVRVVDVVDEEDRIAHVLAEPLTVGTVEGVIDWPRRFDHMQQHTGQHLLSAVLAERFGYQTVSVHFGPLTSTLDLEVGAMSSEEIRRAEAEANTIAAENRPVEISFEEAATAPGLRKATDRSGTIRIVTIRGLDRSACGGTHVRATGEIGAILLRKAERVKKQVRLEFLCGLRAVNRARADLDILAGIAAGSSAAIDDLPALFEKQRADLKAADLARRTLEEALHRYRARELYDSAAADRTGLRRIVQRLEAGSVDSLRGLAQAVAALPRALFLGAAAAPPAILLATSSDSGMDAGGLLKPLLQELGGRGGGSPRLAQGTLPEKADVETALARLATAAGPAAAEDPSGRRATP